MLKSARCLNHRQEKKNSFNTELKKIGRANSERGLHNSHKSHDERLRYFIRVFRDGRRHQDSFWTLLCGSRACLMYEERARTQRELNFTWRCLTRESLFDLSERERDRQTTTWANHEKNGLENVTSFDWEKRKSYNYPSSKMVVAEILWGFFTHWPFQSSSILYVMNH